MLDTHRNLTNGRKMAEDPAKPKYSRSDVRYWRTKVQKQKKGKWESQDYSVRIAFRGQRALFPLETPNREKAGDKAQAIYFSLQANGWEETHRRYKPEPEKPERVATVGEYIEAASEIAHIEPRTLNEYIKSFRRLVAEIFQLNAKGRFDWKGGRYDKWRKRVDRVRLDQITPGHVERWKKGFMEKVGDDPARRRASKTTANTILRNAKGLFGKKILPVVTGELLLPVIHPLADVQLFPRQSMRYLSRINAEEVLQQAVEKLAAPRQDEEDLELATSRHQQFKILLLAIMVGLRKNEIDKLLWEQIDLQRGIIRIEATAYFRPKTEEAAAAIHIDDEIRTILQGYRAKAKGKFVIEATKPAKPTAGYCDYRASIHHKRLIAWLRSLEFDGEKPLEKVQKPIHELRKEAGSLVNSRHGIHAASLFLRHSSIKLTSEHYVDQRMAFSTGLGTVFHIGEDSPSAESQSAPGQMPQAVGK